MIYFVCSEYIKGKPYVFYIQYMLRRTLNRTKHFSMKVKGLEFIEYNNLDSPRMMFDTEEKDKTHWILVVMFG